MKPAAQKFLLDRVRRVNEPPIAVPATPAAVKAAAKVILRHKRELEKIAKAKLKTFYAQRIAAQEACYGEDFAEAVAVVKTFERMGRSR